MSGLDLGVREGFLEEAISHLRSRGDQDLTKRRQKLREFHTEGGVCPKAQERVQSSDLRAQVLGPFAPLTSSVTLGKLLAFLCFCLPTYGIQYD